MIPWLASVRQKSWTMMLSVVVGVNLIWPGSVGREGLRGWWVEENRQSGDGHWSYVVKKRNVTVSDDWVKMERWVRGGFWIGVSGSLVWWLGLHSGAGWAWMGLLIVSHHTRTVVTRGWAQWQTEVMWAEVTAATEQALRRELEEERAGPQLERPKEIEMKSEADLNSPAAVMGQTLAQVVKDVPVGTNQGLLLFMWMLVSGQLLASRGAIFPGLKRTGLSDAESRRVWTAFAKGRWQIEALLKVWQQQVEEEGVWQEHRLGPYRVKAVDLVGFWRPTLQNCPGQHYKAEAGRALPAIVLGVVTRVGQMGSQRVPLPCLFVRANPDDPSEKQLMLDLLQQVKATLAADELAVLDAGFKLKTILAVGLPRYVVRLADNFTARRNKAADYQGHGPRPQYGQVIRPLARSYNGRFIAATPPDREESWQQKHKDKTITITAQFWDDLVLRQEKPGAANFNVIAIHDPRYKDPLLLATSLELDGQTVRDIYQDRWPVEQLPLAAKQMLGVHRQFVHAPESCQRLPELSLLAGAILTYVAAKFPPIPTGFWDRAPKPTPGRLRRVLEGLSFPPNLPLPARIRRKASQTDHLPKGILAHRRQKRVLQPV